MAKKKPLIFTFQDRNYAHPELFGNQSNRERENIFSEHTADIHLDVSYQKLSEDNFTFQQDGTPAHCGMVADC